jgi:hypothetical protein
MNMATCNICGAKDVAVNSSLCAACSCDYHEYDCISCGENCVLSKEHYPKHKETQICDICEKRELLRTIPTEKLAEIDSLIMNKQKISAIKLMGEELNLSPVQSGRLVGIREVWINEKNI